MSALLCEVSGLSLASSKAFGNGLSPLGPEDPDHHSHVEQQTKNWSEEQERKRRAASPPVQSGPWSAKWRPSSSDHRDCHEATCSPRRLPP